MLTILKHIIFYSLGPYKQWRSEEGNREAAASESFKGLVG